MSFTQDQALGMLLGLAVGDAMGTTLEFSSRDSLPHVSDLVGGGPFGLKPGQWTDDTSMALCLGESLVKHPEWNPADCATRFANWMNHGYMSVTGTCFDIGMTCRNAIEKFLHTNEPYSGPTAPDTAGNGGIMRLAPAVIAFSGDKEMALQTAINQSRITHGAPECDTYAKAMAQFLFTGELTGTPLRLPKSTPRDNVASTGYVRHTYEAAFWAYENTSSFHDAIVLAVNLAGDADTTGAVAGQIAGRAYGLSGIPEGLLEKLYWRDEITGLANRLFSASDRRI